MRELIKPGFFGCTATADDRRIEFDIRNEQYLHREAKDGLLADVVFFGDSMTQNWELEFYFNRKALKINRGIGGDTTVNAAKRFEADVLQLRPRAVVFLLGFNDLLSTAPDLWWKKPGADIDEVLGNIEKSYRDMLSRCSDVKAYVCSLIPQSMCAPYDRKYFTEQILRINKILKSLCDEYGAVYVDYYSAIEENNSLREDYTIDGVHPNGRAYEIMAKALKEKVDIL